MIRIARDRKDENGNAIIPDSAWQAAARQETARAIAEGPAHEAKAGLYGHDKVRAALEGLFHDKCSYCETHVAAGSNWDVEHFRPKGRVAENANHPGYYWLAYAWSNLFLGCTLCNQRRRDKPRWGDLSAGPSAGKLDQFPLAVEANRASSHADALDREEPLLLNPCEGEDPEGHLRPTPTGALDPRAGSEKGRASIAVYHLNRRRLKDRRREVILNAVAAVGFLQKAEGRGDAAAAADWRGYIRRHLTDESAPYAAAARAVVRDPAAFGL